MKIRGTVCCALQRCSSKTGKRKSKNNSIFKYKYRSIFRVWKYPFENCNVATRNSECRAELAPAMLSACSLDKVNAQQKFYKKILLSIREPQ